MGIFDGLFGLGRGEEIPEWYLEDQLGVARQLYAVCQELERRLKHVERLVANKAEKAIIDIEATTGTEEEE